MARAEDKVKTRRKQVVETFESPNVALGYRASALHRKGYTLQRIVQLVKSERSASMIVDLGGGCGHLGVALSKGAHRIVLADRSFRMLEAAEAMIRGLSRIFRVNCTGEELPFEDSFADVVVSRLAFHHFHNLGASISEIHRILKPEGTLIFADVSVPEQPNSGSLINEMQSLRDPSHYASRPVSEWLFFLESRGLVVEHLEYGYLDGPRSFREWARLTQTPTRKVKEIVDLIESNNQNRELLKIVGDVRVPRATDGDFTFQFPRVLVKARDHKLSR